VHWQKEFALARQVTLRSALGALVFFVGLSPSVHIRASQRADPETLPASQFVEPSDLGRELASASTNSRLTIVYVGFRALFAGGHIPGATYHGSASTPQGLAEIKKWAASLPRTTNLVIYCGCCPFERCPNIRPAFTLFHDLGFAHVRVLELRISFAADWADKGYPVEKGWN
jgi:hypothetical protein